MKNPARAVFNYSNINKFKTPLCCAAGVQERSNCLLNGYMFRNGQFLRLLFLRKHHF